MADKDVIYTGDMVKICIKNAVSYGGMYSVWLTDGMKEFDGEEFIVSRIYGSSQKAYELKGVNNKHGMPYTWMKDALVKVKEERMTNREKCLNKAMEIVTGDREQAYGTPEDNFRMIAELWSSYLEADVSAVDVAMMMSLLKIARISTGTFKEDSFVDLAGYAACGYEIASRNGVKVGDALMKATLSEYAPIEELASYMGVRD